MIKTTVAAMVLFLAGAGVSSAQPCLHGSGEVPAQRARRQEALRLARQINTAENFGRTPQAKNPYRPLTELTNVGPVPAGFVVQLTTDGATYSFSIKDMIDPCRYTIFSDQEGIIFHGAPVVEGGIVPITP